MKEISGNYNVVPKNCSQTSLGILSKADTAYQKVLSRASTIITPVDAFNRVSIMAIIIKYIVTRGRFSVLKGQGYVVPSVGEGLDPP